MRFVPGCEAKCCGTIPPPCGFCDPDPGDTIALAISGFADNRCSNCEIFNSTFILTRETGVGSTGCLWSFHDDDLCGVGYYSASDVVIYDIYASISLVAGKVTWDAWLRTFNIYGWPSGHYETVYWRWASTSTTDIDCTATRDLVYRTKSVTVSFPFASRCSNYELTACQINP